ncbi:hypothetical protein T11_9951 [Trichinella zimbabwensis]|nr:hypothetical protein T11_9951 [Trichinella zimbabwensis]
MLWLLAYLQRRTNNYSNLVKFIRLKLAFIEKIKKFKTTIQLLHLVTTLKVLLPFTTLYMRDIGFSAKLELKANFEISYNYPTSCV